MEINDGVLEMLCEELQGLEKELDDLLEKKKQMDNQESDFKLGHIKEKVDQNAKDECLHKIAFIEKKVNILKNIISSVNYGIFDEYSKKISSDKDVYDDLCYSVVDDYQKSKKLVDLAVNFTSTSERSELEKAGNSVVSISSVPRNLYDGLVELDLRANPDNYRMNIDFDYKSADKIIEKTVAYKEEFENAKKEFIEIFSKEKLSKLRLPVRVDEVFEPSHDYFFDVEFYKQHSDKITDGKLEKIQQLISLKGKTKNIIEKNKIIQEINHLHLDIYGEVKKWHERKFSNMSHILGFDWFNFDRLISSFDDAYEEVMKRIDRCEQAMETVMDDVNEKKVSYYGYYKNYAKKRREEILQEIKNLGGSEFADVNIGEPSFNFNIEYLRECAANGYNVQMVNKVDEYIRNKEVDIKDQIVSGGKTR